MTTEYPACKRAIQVCVPMNPAPPVTRISPISLFRPFSLSLFDTGDTMSAIYYYSIADFSFFFKSYLQRNQIFFRDGGRCCKKRENLVGKRAGKRHFERFFEMLLNMKCSLTENRNYVILFLKNRQEGTKLSPEEEVQRLEQRIAQLEQALQEKNAPASLQPTVSPTIPQQETPPTIPPPAPEIPPMQTTQPTPPPPSFQPNIPWTSQAQTMQSVPPPQQMDTEQKFGKIVMGILASIFIFAAILIGYAFLPSILQMVGSSLEQAFPLLDFTEFLRRSIPTFS